MIKSQKERQYFLGVGLPLSESRFLSDLKQYFHPQRRLTSPPHITIKPPFYYPNKALLISKLTSFTRDRLSFKVNFNKVAVFDNRRYASVVLLPDRSQWFKELEADLSLKINHLPRLKNFYPHLTIAHRVPKDTVDWVKQQIRALNIKIKLIVDNLTLYSRQPPAVWQVFNSFKFSGDNLKTANV